MRKGDILLFNRVNSQDIIGFPVRRQTLYNRLARIEELLGGRCLYDHERRTALELALVAYRLRFAAATR